MDGQKGAGRARGQGRASRTQNQQGPGGPRRPQNVPTPGQPQQSAWGQARGGGDGQQQGSGRGGGGQQQTAWRGRGGQQQQQSAWGGGQQQQQARPAPAPQQSAWGQPRQPGAGLAGPSTSAAAATAAPPQRHQAPSIQGRATTHRETTQAEPARGAVAKEDARGSVRGRRVISEFVATRPKGCVSKCGHTGTKVVVQANYFRVLKKPRWSIFQYHVDFAPDVDLIKQRRNYIHEHRALFTGFLFDGSMLFTTTNLDTPTKELYCKNAEGEPIQIKIKNVGEIKVTDIQLLQVLNLILRRSMAGLSLQLVGRNFFDPQAKIYVETHRLEIWPGYTTSIRQHEQDILLCAEVSHKIMRCENLLQILINTAQKTQDYQNEFKRLVCGTVVLTGYNNKTYRIDDVDFNQTPMSTFSTPKGEISYVDYYAERYKLTIHDRKQPLLVSRPTERNIRSGQNTFIMLIPELARATGLTDNMKSNYHLMKSVAEYTRLGPEPRIQRLKMFQKRLQSSPASQSVLESWNLQLDRELVQLPGRILKPENILFGSNRRYICDRNADWNREFREGSMFVQKDIKRWYLIVPQRNSREGSDFVRMIRKAAGGMRMNIAEPRAMEMPDDRNGTYASAIEKACVGDPQIVLVIVPNDNAERYSCIKKKCVVDRAVPSQVVNMKTIAPRGGKASGLMSIATKVVIQMNAKLLGAPWMIELPLKGLMTVGFDVCHSARDALKSYGALVATMDLKASTSYFSAVTEHLKGQELSTDIVLNITKALKVYRETHGALPERILFFRDGVGDGQLQQVVDSEITILKEKLDQIYKQAGIENGSRLAFIVVSKRINTRLFINGANPSPGLVVDDVVTLPERYDFFLVSQSVRQGTVSPTSYNVIHDSMGFDADRLQILTYKMTHMYFNWSGTCRVPAVCQYAHKLAFMVAQYLHRAPSNALETQLYFL